MPPYSGYLEVPDDNFRVPNSENEMDNTVTAEMLRLHALNGSQRQADGASAYAENLRYNYLEGKDNLSMTESMGPRYLQGPHPQHGSPDFSK